LRRSISACFEHRRDQLTLAALNFSFLHGNLAGFLDLLDLDLLGHYLLLHDIGLDLVRLVCGRLLLLDSFEEIRLLELEIALSFRLRRLRKCFRKDAFLIGLRFGDGGCAHGLGTLDRGVALGFGGGHVGVPLDPRDIGPAHVGDVIVFVTDFFNCERDDLQPHLVHIVGAGGAHAVADHFGLLYDLFHRELPDNPAQVALQHQADQSLALLRCLGEKLFRSGLNRLGIGFDLDLRDGFHRHCDALFCVEVLLRRDVE